MKKYRSKPVEIEAERWWKVGKYFEGKGRIVDFYRHPNYSGKLSCEVCKVILHDHGWVDTLEQGHRVCPGDWIIKGLEGEFYPCKDSVFQKKYEEVLEEQTYVAPVVTSSK